MTAKEKAEELFDKMFSSSRSITVEQSKKCALVAVDEVIKTICYCYPINEYEISFVEYWQEVKSEIEKL